MNRIDRDTYELSTGRRIYANRGILGLDPDPGDCPADSRLTHGYDDEVSEGKTELTPAERREIAEYQIKRWAEWAGLADPWMQRFEFSLLTPRTYVLEWKDGEKTSRLDVVVRQGRKGMDFTVSASDGAAKILVSPPAPNGDIVTLTCEAGALRVLHANPDPPPSPVPGRFVEIERKL